MSFVLCSHSLLSWKFIWFYSYKNAFVCFFLRVHPGLILTAFSNSISVCFITSWPFFCIVMRKIYKEKNPSESIHSDVTNNHVDSSKNSSRESLSNPNISENMTTKIEITEHSLEFNSLHDNEQNNTSLADNIVITYDNQESNFPSVNPPQTNQNSLVGLKHFFKDRKVKNTGHSYFKIESLEKYEKLFIRLEKMDISSKLKDQYVDKSVEFCSAEHPSKIDETLSENILKPIERTCMSEVYKPKIININKTESIKMEQLLLEQNRRQREKQLYARTIPEDAEISTVGIEPFTHEKTTSSSYETYERVVEGGGTIFRCLLCPFTGEGYRQLSLHYRFKHKEIPLDGMHFCNVNGCKFKAFHKGLCKRHMRRHMLVAEKLVFDLYPCGKCDKVFDQRKGFLIHLKHMHKDSVSTLKKYDFPCGTCNFRTNNELTLQLHINRCHVPKQKYKCNVCDFETAYKESLRKHLYRVHLGQQN